MKKFLFFYLLLFPFCFTWAQEQNEDEMSKAFLNAKKGVFWALENIPTTKLKLNHQLVSDDKLIADVKLEVEVNGIKIISTGYFNSTEVSVKVFKSVENLQKEGYLKNKKLKSPVED
jgi:hypothetical protein